MTRHRLLTEKDYSSYLIVNDADIPTSIIVTPSNDPDHTTLQCNLDAADSMSFCNIPANTSSAAILCLSNTLQKHYGGKNMFSAPKPPGSLIESLGIHARPVTPASEAFENLMQADLSAVREKFAGDDAGIKSKKYTFITDKQMLMNKADEISALFLKTYTDKKANAEFASRESKRNYYSPSAMKARLNDPHVSAVAVAANDGQIVGFLRGYSEPGIGTYVSDLLIDRAHEGIMLSRNLMREGLALLPGADEKLFLIAGNPTKEIAQYKRLGFTSVSKSRVEFPDNKQFMFGMFPAQEILTDLGTRLGKDLNMPPPAPVPQERNR